MTAQTLHAIAQSTHVAAARRAACDDAVRAGFDETGVGRIAIAVTEAATNLLKHAGGGEILLRRLAGNGLEVLAIDRGPGIADLAHSLRDGHSTAGTAGTGLGAMRRLAAEFDAYSGGPQGGLVLRMGFWPQQSAGGTQVPPSGAVCLPKPGESVAGDAWSLLPLPHGAAVMVADGLGHGPDAARASQLALNSLHLGTPASVLEGAHAALRTTRGAAVAAARIDAVHGQLHFAGIGNIGASLVGPGGARQLVSHTGIVGHNMRKVQEFAVPWGPDHLFVLFSDGLATRWDLARYPGLAARHPGLVAAALYRDHSRGRDDVTVLVVKHGMQERS